MSFIKRVTFVLASFQTTKCAGFDDSAAVVTYNGIVMNGDGIIVNIYTNFSVASSTSHIQLSIISVSQLSGPLEALMTLLIPQSSSEVDEVRNKLPLNLSAIKLLPSPAFRG